MTITVEASGTSRARIPSRITLDGVKTVGEAIEQLHLPAEDHLIMLVNGRVAHWTTELRDGDVLRLLPTIGGGCAPLRGAAIQMSRLSERGNHERWRNLG